jgi:putative redox protein
MTPLATPAPPIVVTHLDGVRFDAEIRGHHIVLDQPLGKGDDTGPSPLELLGAALGSCVALYVRRFCQARAIPYEGLRVEVYENRENNPTRITEFLVDVQLPEEVDDRTATLLEAVIKSCPVHNTLVGGVKVHPAIECGLAVCA